MARQETGRALVRALCLFIAIALVLGSPFFLFGPDFTDVPADRGAVSWLETFGHYAWVTGVGLLIADLVLPVPTTAVMTALGIVYGPWLGGLISALGSVASGLVGYGVGRFLGRPIVRRVVGAQALSEGDRLFADLGGWMVALSRWLPIVSEVVACMAGLSRLRFPIFAAALACGSVPLGFAFAAIGEAGADRPLLTLALGAAAPFVLWGLVRPLLKRRASL